MRRIVIMVCLLSLTGCAVQVTKLPRYIRPDWTTVGGAFWNKPAGGIGTGTDIVAYTLDQCSQDNTECAELASGALASETAIEQILSSLAQSVPIMEGLRNIPADRLNVNSYADGGRSFSASNSFSNATAKAASRANATANFNRAVHYGSW